MAANKKKDKDKKSESNLIARNRRARFEYHLHETFEAGIELKGSEVKSVRDRKVSIEQCYGRMFGNEIYLVGMNIAAYEPAKNYGHEPTRPRKLLLHKREVLEIASYIMQPGYTLVPVRMYFRHGYAKIEVAVATGKKQYDKREDIKKRDAEREMRREVGKGRMM